MKPDQAPSFNRAKGVCVEVGTWQGGFTESILEKSNVIKVFAVDPYKHFINSEYPDAMNDMTQKQFDDLFNNVSDKLKTKYAGKIEFIRELSTSGAEKFADLSLDFVYIDGNHDYKYVLQDLKAWYPKVKYGGYLCGDDVWSTNLEEHDSDGNVTMRWSQTSWGKYGTYKAVVDFGKEFKIEQTQFSILKI